MRNKRKVSVLVYLVPVVLLGIYMLSIDYDKINFERRFKAWDLKMPEVKPVEVYRSQSFTNDHFDYLIYEENMDSYFNAYIEDRPHEFRPRDDYFEKNIISLDDSERLSSMLMGSDVEYVSFLKGSEKMLVFIKSDSFNVVIFNHN